MAGGGGGAPAKKSTGPNPLTGESGPFGSKAPARESTSVDMTAMIDLVFMMNIFFMVTSLVTAEAGMELPQARHVSGVDPDESLILRISADEKTGAKVFIGEGEAPLPDAGRDEKITQAVADSVRLGKPSLLIKGDKNLTMTEVGKIGAAAAAVEGVKPYYAVTEAGAEEKLH
jgi:biopolymer transport protein ExbD